MIYIIKKLVVSIEDGISASYSSSSFPICISAQEIHIPDNTSHMCGVFSNNSRNSSSSSTSLVLPSRGNTFPHDRQESNLQNPTVLKHTLIIFY